MCGRFRRWVLFVRPRRIHLTGGYIGDIIPEGDGHVAGGGGGFAEVDGDIFRDDDFAQHPGVTIDGRGGAAAAAAREEGVGGDDDGLRGSVPGLLGGGDHLGLGQRHLPGEDLHPLNADGAVAGFGGGEVADGVGAGGGVLFLKREGAGGGSEGDIRHVALGVGGVGEGEAVAGHGDDHPIHRGGLPGGEGLNAQDASSHNKILLCRKFVRFSIFDFAVA